MVSKKIRDLTTEDLDCIDKLLINELQGNNSPKISQLIKIRDALASQKYMITMEKW